MKKIILLEILLTVAIVVLTILIGVGIYAFSLVPAATSLMSLVTGIVIEIVLLIGLILVRQALSSFITKGFFNRRSALNLKYSGWVFVFFSIVNGGLSISSTISKEQMFSYLFYLMVLMAGLGLTIVANLVARGEDIENENKLTI